MMKMDELITAMFAVKIKIADIKKEHLKPLEEEKKELESQIFDALDEIGVDSTRLKGIGSVGVIETVVPQAEDWDRFYEYIMEDKMRFLLLNKALNGPAFREALTIEGEIPGLVPFTKRTLSVTKAA